MAAAWRNLHAAARPMTPEELAAQRTHGRPPGPDAAPSAYSIKLWTDVPADLKHGPWPWAILTHWAVVAGRFDCVGVELRSFRHPGETDNRLRHLPLQHDTTETVSTTLVRGIPWAQVIDDTRDAELSGFQFDVPEQRDEEWSAERQAWQAPGRDTDARYREVARVYSAAFAAGKAPTQAVARRFQLSPAAAANLVKRARQRGFLPPTKPGRASGQARKDQP